MLDALLEPLFHGVGYWTDKLLVRLVSFGRLHVAIAAELDENAKGRQHWHRITFTRGGKRYVDAELVSLIGIGVWVGVIAGVVYLVRRG